MSLKYEPASEPLHISVKSLFIRGTLSLHHCHTVMGTFAFVFVPGTQLQSVDRLRVGGVPREQKMLKGHLPRVISPSILVYEEYMYDAAFS